MSERLSLLRQHPRKLTSAAIAAIIALSAPLIMRAEGEVTATYVDAVGVPTACFGHTGRDVKPGQHYTDGQCRGLLNQDQLNHLNGIAACIDVDVPAPSMAAFTSFSFNIGVAAFCRSSVDRLLNAGNLKGACAGLSAWVFAGGRRLQGLADRRARERALCEQGLEPKT